MKRGRMANHHTTMTDSLSRFRAKKRGGERLCIADLMSFYQSVANNRSKSHIHIEWLSLMIPPSDSKVGSKALSLEPIAQRKPSPHPISHTISHPTLIPSAHPPISIDAARNAIVSNSCPYSISIASPPTEFSLRTQLKINNSSRGLTFVNPISWLFSLKHCRQMLRPYLRIRPALCVQTRLCGPKISANFLVLSLTASSPLEFGDSVSDSPFSRGRRGDSEEEVWEEGRHTILERPCHRCAGASTRLIRGTWLCEVGSGGLSGVAEGR